VSEEPEEQQAEEPKPLAAQWSVPGLIAYYNTIMSPRGITFPIHLMPIAKALLDLRIQKLLAIIGPGSGKSMFMSQIWPSFLLGHDPTQTVLGISAGEALIQGFQRSVMEIIEWSPLYHRIFPNVRPDKAAGWSTERGMFVTGRSPGDPDASYWAAGLDSKSLTGKHGRTIQLDDPHDKENSVSVTACEKVITTWYNTVLGRADPRGARFIVAGRRWNEEDLYGHLKRTGDFVVLELPAERMGSSHLYFDVTVPDGLECVFTEEARAARH
jgi:hypothetical protein